MREIFFFFLSSHLGHFQTWKNLFRVKNKEGGFVARKSQPKKPTQNFQRGFRAQIPPSSAPRDDFHSLPMEFLHPALGFSVGFLPWIPAPFPAWNGRAGSAGGDICHLLLGGSFCPGCRCSGWAGPDVFQRVPVPIGFSHLTNWS